MKTFKIAMMFLTIVYGAAVFLTIGTPHSVLLWTAKVVLTTAPTSAELQRAKLEKQQLDRIMDQYRRDIGNIK